MPDIFVAPAVNPPETKMVQDMPRRPFHKRMGFLSAFAERTYGVTFANQKSNEEIVLFLRAHLITNFLWIAITIFLLFIPLLGSVVVNFIPSPFSFVSGKILLIFLIFYYLIVFSYAFLNFLNWFYNITLITNLGVVDIDYSGLLYHDVAFTNFNLVEDVNYTKVGFFRSLFNYGDVFVQTAGGRENLEALGVPNPARAAHVISNSIGHGEGSG